MRMTSLNKIWPGDIAYKHVNGACFVVTNQAAEQPRADAFEISATAPLYGFRTKLAEAQAGLLEESLLDKEGLTLRAFRLSGGLAMEGERRPLRVPVQATACVTLTETICCCHFHCQKAASLPLSLPRL